MTPEASGVFWSSEGSPCLPWGAPVMSNCSPCVPHTHPGGAPWRWESTAPRGGSSQPDPVRDVPRAQRGESESWTAAGGVCVGEAFFCSEVRVLGG